MAVVKGVACSGQRWRNRVDGSDETASVGIKGVVGDIERVVTRDGKGDGKPCDSSEDWNRVDRFVSLVATERGLRGTSYGTKTDANGRCGTVFCEYKGR